jgi:hypothetical protein
VHGKQPLLTPMQESSILIKAVRVAEVNSDIYFLDSQPIVLWIALNIMKLEVTVWLEIMVWCTHTRKEGGGTWHG